MPDRLAQRISAKARAAASTGVVGLASMLAGNRFYRCPQDKFADVVTKISTGLMAVFYAAEDSIRRGEGLTCREMWKQGFVRLIFCVSVRPCASVSLRCGPPP